MNLHDRKLGSARRQVMYLHGLGSSPLSTKAVLMTQRLFERGFSVRTPDLNLPSFEQLSPALIVRAVTDIVSKQYGADAQSCLDLIGSSFGGFIALHALAALRPEIRARIGRLVLLAPAVDLWHPQSKLLSPEIEEQWRAAEKLPLFHHGRKQPILVHYGFVEELRALNRIELIPTLPTLFIHGTHDDVVSHEQSVHLARKCPNAKVVLTEDGHDLLKDPEQLARWVGDFLSL
jgi:pimeloyl-ACP methyl ester carboxylesterase